MSTLTRAEAGALPPIDAYVAARLLGSDDELPQGLADASIRPVAAVRCDGALQGRGALPRSV